MIEETQQTADGDSGATRLAFDTGGVAPQCASIGQPHEKARQQDTTAHPHARNGHGKGRRIVADRLWPRPEINVVDPQVVSFRSLHPGESETDRP